MPSPKRKRGKNELSEGTVCNRSSGSLLTNGAALSFNHRVHALVDLEWDQPG